MVTPPPPGLLSSARSLIYICGLGRTFPLLYLSPYLTFSSNPSCISSNGGGDSFMLFYPHCRASSPRSPHHHLPIPGPWGSCLRYSRSSLATRCTKYSPLLLLPFRLNSLVKSGPKWSVLCFYKRLDQGSSPQTVLHIMTESQVKPVRNLFPVRASRIFPTRLSQWLLWFLYLLSLCSSSCLALTPSRMTMMVLSA